MYAKDRSASGTERAFEAAYARESYLRRSAAEAPPVGMPPDKPQKPPVPEAPTVLPIQHESALSEKPPSLPAAPPKEGRSTLERLFGSDKSDALLLLLILFFLTDGDTENDAVIPLLLVILFLF